jgi:cystathionine beta-lyase family protein involved in aluminum resistance
MTIRSLLTVSLSAIAFVSSADTPTYSIDAHIVSAGTSVHSTSACFGLDATIAEPIAGFSSGGVYNLSAGFAYAAPIASDNIFGNGFEDCSQ